MRRELVILLVLCSVFLAIGCAENGAEEPATPVEEVTPVETVTPVEAVTPIEAITSIEAITPVETVTPASNATPETGGEGQTIDVSIKDFAFNPEEVTISAGDTVRWTNLDSITHTIKGPDFESDTLRDGDSYSFVFTKPGVYEYECSIHPSMKGTVTVTE